jgi:hypothetical protein
MLRRVVLISVVWLFAGATPAWSDPSIDVGRAKADNGQDGVNVSARDSKNITGTQAAVTHLRRSGYAGVVDTEYPPTTRIVDYVSPQQASALPFCDGGSIVPVAGNIIIQCVVASGTSTTGDPAPPEVVDFAKSYFSSIQLPVPQPEISAPNGGICGVTHSLDLHIPVEKLYETDGTAFGDVDMHIYGRVNVDWGDGTPFGQYTTSGAPYPNSQISHVWTTKGFYNIAVTVSWDADVVIGPYNGQTYEVDLTGLTTTGGIQNWRVWEAQAVITS